LFFLNCLRYTNQINNKDKMTKLTPNEEDLKLVDAIVNSTGRDQRAAYNALFNKYYPKMLRFLKYRFNNFRDAEIQDVAIEGLTKAFRANTLAGYEPSSNFSTWIYHSITNKAIDLFRKENKFDTMSIEEMKRPDSDSSVEVSIDYMTPERVMFNEETFDLIKSCIKQLSNAQREIVELSIIEDLNDKEIIFRIWGDTLSEDEIVSKANTVRATIHRGRKVLRILLEEEGVTV
jgi:RNA polymerase sigma factor (sigma-70 family)